jgi:hypothetical protein
MHAVPLGFTVRAIERDCHWRAVEHDCFMLDDTTYELQGLVAVVGLGGDERLVEDLPHHVGGRGLLKLGDEMPSGLESAFAFGFVADIGGLEGEIDASSRAYGLIRGHDLLAKEKAGFGS